MQTKQGLVTILWRKVLLMLMYASLGIELLPTASASVRCSHPDIKTRYKLQGNRVVDHSCRVEVQGRGEVCVEWFTCEGRCCDGCTSLQVHILVLDILEPSYWYHYHVLVLDILELSYWSLLCNGPGLHRQQDLARTKQTSKHAGPPHLNNSTLPQQYGWPTRLTSGSKTFSGADNLIWYNDYCYNQLL